MDLECWTKNGLMSSDGNAKLIKAGWILRLCITVKSKPKPEEFNMDYIPKDLRIILRFKKTPSARPAEAK